MGGRRRVRPLAGFALGAGLLLLVAAGCATVLSLGDYEIERDAGEGGTSGEDGPIGGEAGCDVDLSVQCYACEPTTNIELLNACTEGNCVAFDRARLVPLLLPDGALPPLPLNPPVPDAGSDAADAADGGG